MSEPRAVRAPIGAGTTGGVYVIVVRAVRHESDLRGEIALLHARVDADVVRQAT